MVVGLFDWDAARPGPASDDIAYALLWTVPIETDPSGAPLAARETELRQARAAALLDGYGWSSPLDVVDAAVARHALAVDEVQWLGVRGHEPHATWVDEGWPELASRSQELAELTSTRKRPQAETEKLLAAHFADAIDLDTLERHQDRIRAGLADIDRKLENDHEQYTGRKKYLATALQLVTYCATMYRQSDDEARRLANQAFFEKIYIGEDEQAVPE
jgi:hypothetical protein